jgi:2-dehydro-3-deoxyphosphogluconate aldolase / (4S)-4-hydroxy-2-oxoglutarate aldolase
MARFARLEVLNTMTATGLVPVFYHGDAEVVKNVARAVHEGGCPIIEFTNRGDFAAEVFAELEKFCRKEIPGMITGVGSIVDPVSAVTYIQNGANFVVGPVLNPEVARACNRRKVPYSPGCGTASEVSTAEELGCEIVKIFPGETVGGPSFVKSIKGPMPWTSIMPTGGVDPTRESLAAWFGAGVTCVGIGSNLITKEFVKTKNWNGIRDLVKSTLALIKEVRAAKSKA